MTVATGTALLPTYARFPVTFVDGDGCWLIADDGRASSTRRGHRRRQPRPLPPGAARGRAGAARPALARLEPLLDRADGASSPTKLSDRFGGAQAFFCNSGHRGGRGGDQVGAQGDRPHGARRARGLVPRPDDGRALDHGPAGEARAVRAAGAGRPLRDARRRSPTPSAPTRPRSSSSRCRARAACTRSRPRRSSGRARSRTSSRRCSSSTRCRPASAAPATSTPGRRAACGRTR